MEIVFLVILVLAAAVNIFLQISSLLLLIRIFEYLKNIQENANIAEETKLRAKGLVDLATEQVAYPLRLR